MGGRNLFAIYPRFVHEMHIMSLFVVRYDLSINGKSFPQHCYLVINAAVGCGIKTGLYEHILDKLCSKNAKDNMIRDEVNTDEHSNGDHCFERLMMTSIIS